MNPSPFEELGQQFAAEYERTQRMMQSAQSIGERMAAQVQQIVHYPSPLAEIVQRGTQTEALMATAIPNAADIVREVQRASEASRLTAQIVSQSQLWPGVVESVQRASAEITALISGSAKPTELPGDWPKNYRLPVECASYAVDVNDVDLFITTALAAFQDLSDDEIVAALDGDVSLKTTLFGVCELTARRIERAMEPHWTVTWEFWLVVASFLIALWLAFRP